MTPDPLKILLQRADAHSELELLPAAEMARRVEDVARRQRQRTATAIACVLPLLLVAITITAWPGTPPLTQPQMAQQESAQPAAGEPAIAVNVDSQQPAELPIAAMSAADVQQALAEIAALEAEANFHLQVARRIVAERDRDASFTLARIALADAEPKEVVRERLDLVAYRMIARADLLRNEPHPKEDPVEIYRDVVRLFPDTSSANEARLRLAELNPIEPPGGA